MENINDKLFKKLVFKLNNKIKFYNTEMNNSLRKNLDSSLRHELYIKMHNELGVKLNSFHR